MNKRLMALAILTASSLLLTACATSGETAAETETPDANAVQPLNIGNFLDVMSWDPAGADLGFDSVYLSAVYDALVTVDGSGETQPGLATDWETSDDFLTITFDVRTDAVFSDGTPVDVEAIVKGLEHLRSGTTSQEAYKKVSAIKPVDKDTLEVQLSERDDTMLYLMGLGRSYIAAPAAIDAGTLTTAPVGSGPYTLGSASVPGTEYVFDKVADHWDGAQFPFEPLKITPLSDFTAQLNGLEAGQLQIIYGDKAASDLAEANDWNASSGLAAWVGLSFTDRSGDMGSPFGDVKVRQALNYAFDREGIRTSILQGDGEATNQMFPVDTPGYVASLNDATPYDMEKAKELLAEAGFADGFEVTMPMAPQFMPYQAIVEQTFADLNITVKWEETDFISYSGKAPTYPAFITVSAMDSNPIATVERQISEVQMFNPNPGVDQIEGLQEQLDVVQSAAPGDAQIAAVEALNKIVVEQGYNNVWAQNVNTYVSTPDFEVEPVTGLMFPTLRQISLGG